MAPEVSGFGRALILVGVVLIGVGLLAMAAPKFPWIGRLPGDIMVQRQNFTFYFPLTSCVLASLLITIIAWIVSRFR